MKRLFFPLHPETPQDGLALEDLFEGRGYDLNAMYMQMKARMDAEGLAYGQRSHTYNSRLAQELAKWADTQFGRVISKLEALNVLDDFVIVFLSDHGEMLGEKGLWEKQQYFDSSVRVPFFISLPQKFNRGSSIIKENVSLVDLFPTLCEIAQVPIPSGLDGRSLVPLMEGRSDGWSNEVYSELYHPLNGPSVMVKQDNMKYFRFEGRDWPEQLFNLDADPSENHNLIDKH